jgi:carbonic anhydrase/acetyltransferase-like protein (isoleucine patch superfamily)
MKHLNSARDLASTRGLFILLISSVLLFVNLTVSTHPSAAVSHKATAFIDPTAVVQCGPPTFKNCTFGQDVYIGPFATLKAGLRSPDETPSITIGNSSDVQDNALLDTTTNKEPITLGEKVIIAHGAHVFGGARIGVSGTCEGGASVCPSFVGFNAEVAQTAVVERDAMVGHLARVGPGVRIRSGLVVLPGKNVTSEAEIPKKTREICEADRKFMDAVIHVNVALAAGYIELQEQDRSNVRGINYNPITDLVPTRTLPSFAGTPMRNPNSPTRIIGDVRLADAALPPVGMNVSLRADEGTPFIVGKIGSLENSTTFHALEHSKLTLGDNGRYGAGSIMHGGPFNNQNTSTGSNFILGNDSVFFNSTAGNNCKVGAMSFVSDTTLAANTIVGDKIVLLAGQESVVEWDRRTRTQKRGNRGKRGR